MWVLLSILVPVVIGLILAVLLVHKRTRLFYSAIFFLPVTVAPIMAAVVWGWIYNPTFGALTRKQWGRCLFLHIDFHLTQFGIHGEFAKAETPLSERAKIQ